MIVINSLSILKSLISMIIIFSYELYFSSPWFFFPDKVYPQVIFFFLKWFFLMDGLLYILLIIRYIWRCQYFIFIYTYISSGFWRCCYIVLWSCGQWFCCRFNYSSLVVSIFFFPSDSFPLCHWFIIYSYNYINCCIIYFEACIVKCIYVHRACVLTGI